MELHFPIVSGAYGGNQAWFEKELWAAGGCGVIAAANLYYYFKGELVVDRADYMELATALYYWLRPLHFFNPSYSHDTYGLISAGLFRDRTLRFFRIRGLQLQARIHRFIKKRALGLIKEGLDRGELPLIMVQGIPKTNAYVNHFMVVTGYEGDSLYLSSWGRKLLVPFSELSQGGNFFNLLLFRRI